jgi:hypothetical protein
LTKPLHSVLLGAHSQYRGVLNAVARNLKEHDNAAVHLYCASEQLRDYYRRRVDVGFDTISVDNALNSASSEPVLNAEKVVSEARRNEAELGVTYNLLAMSDRHLGRGYALAGFKHPRSHKSADTSYLQMVAGLNQAVDFWRQEIAEKKPQLIVNCGKIAAVVAKAAGIPYRALAASRYRNFHYWARNELFENPQIEEAYRESKESSDFQMTAPYDTHVQMRRQLKQTYALPSTLKWMSVAIAQYPYRKIRGYDKKRGYYLRDNLAYMWRRHRERNGMSGADTVTLADLAGQPFVYYPLHTEPETALQTLSPEYFYQLSSIAALSRDLPAGVLLAVKETYAALGRRPTDFYGQIREFKNVVMLDINEIGLECARAADVTATITGTGGFEAAAMGRPVVSFGRHNLYNFLPHVMVVDDELHLPKFLSLVFNGGFDADVARRDGLRFLQAIADTSFDLGDFRVTHPDAIAENAATAAYRALIDSIEEVAPSSHQDKREVAL